MAAAIRSGYHWATGHPSEGNIRAPSFTGWPMIRLSITPAAYLAIAATLPGNVGVERERARPTATISSGSIRGLSIGSRP